MVKTKISLIEIKQAFDDLIQEKKSREEISNWAQKILFTEDEGQLIYDPPIDEDKIWQAIKYLIGGDLKISPKIYFYSKEDFIEYRKRFIQKMST